MTIWYGKNDLPDFDDLPVHFISKFKLNYSDIVTN